MNSDSRNPGLSRRSKGRWCLGGLLLLLAVYEILPRGIRAQTPEEESLDSGPIREAHFVINDRVAAVALQADGKIVVAGESDRGFAVVRYLSSGEVDRSFGTDGKVMTRIGTDPEIEDAVSDMALQADGKIVVVGRTWQRHSNDLVVVRYTADGNLDASFGKEGKVINDLSAGYDEASALVIQADGKLVVGGLATDGIALVRYNPDGTADFGFNSHVMVTRSRVGRIVVHALALQSDGKIVAVGRSADNKGLNSEFVLARYNSDGSLNPSFGAGGTVTTQIGTVDTASDVALQADGKLVVVGTSFNGRSVDFAMVRYHPDGTLDSSFGTGGKVTSDYCAHTVESAQPLGTGAISGGGWRVQLQPDGKLVVAGNPSSVLCHGFVVRRYNPDGSLDSSFGTNGQVTTTIVTNDGYAYALAIQVDSKIVVAGTSTGGFAVVRYNPDGSLDPTFGSGGKVTTRVGRGYRVQ